jgi:ribonuclease P protein subunit POP4
MITPNNLLRHELIGLVVEIYDSTDPTLKSLKGRIVDESKQTLLIEVGGKRKRVTKSICKFRFQLDSKVVEVSGKAVLGRPQDRIKK